jgi:hypothetical protein
MLCGVCELKPCVGGWKGGYCQDCWDARRILECGCTYVDCDFTPLCCDGKDRCRVCCMCVDCVDLKTEDDYNWSVVPCKGKCVPKKMRLKTWWKRCGFDYKCRCAYRALVANPALAEEFINYSH